MLARCSIRAVIHHQTSAATALLEYLNLHACLMLASGDGCRRLSLREVSWAHVHVPLFIVHVDDLFERIKNSPFFNFSDNLNCFKATYSITDFNLLQNELNSFYS